MPLFYNCLNRRAELVGTDEIDACRNVYVHVVVYGCEEHHKLAGDVVDTYTGMLAVANESQAALETLYLKTPLGLDTCHAAVGHKYYVGFG